MARLNRLGHSNTRIVDAAGSMLISLSDDDVNLSCSVYHELLKPMRLECGVVLPELMAQFKLVKVQLLTICEGVNVLKGIPFLRSQIKHRNENRCSSSSPLNYANGCAYLIY